MSDSEAQNAVVPHRYRRAEVGEKEKMTLKKILIHALSKSKEFQEWITSVKV